MLRIESQATGIVFEGRVGEGASEIRGTIELDRSSCRWCCAEAEDIMKAAVGLRRRRIAAALRLLPFGSGVRWRRRCFAATPRTTAPISADGPRAFHRVKWTFPTGDRIVSSPVYEDGVIYFGGDDGNVYAVDATDGRQLWKHKTGGPVAATPAVAGDIVYVGSYDGKFYALEAKSGRRGGSSPPVASGDSRRRICTACCRRTRRSPILSTSSCRARSWRGGRCSSAAATATSIRSTPLPARSTGNSRPATWCTLRRRVADGVVYFGSWDSYFYAVDARTGAQKWRFHGGEDPLIHNQVGFQSSPAVVNGVVYTGCRDSKLYAIDAATGREKWHFDADGSWVVSSPAVVQGKVIFGTSDSSLYLVLDAETGKELVRQQDKAFFFSSPAVAGNTVYIGVLNGTLEARDLASGDDLGVPDGSVEAQRGLGAHRRPEIQRADALLVELARAAALCDSAADRASARSSRRRSSSAAQSTSAALTGICTRWSERGRNCVRAERTGAKPERLPVPRPSGARDDLIRSSFAAYIARSLVVLLVSRRSTSSFAPVRDRRARRTRRQANNGIRGCRVRDRFPERRGPLPQ